MKEIGYNDNSIESIDYIFDGGDLKIESVLAVVLGQFLYRDNFNFLYNIKHNTWEFLILYDTNI